MATKVMTVKPGGKVIRTTAPPTTDDRIKELRRKLGLDHKWESLKFQINISARLNP